MYLEYKALIMAKIMQEQFFWLDLTENAQTKFSNRFGF